MLSGMYGWLWLGCRRSRHTHSYALASSPAYFVGEEKSLVQTVCTCIYNCQGILWPPDTFAACPYPMSLAMLYTNKTSKPRPRVTFPNPKLTPEHSWAYGQGCRIHVFLHTLITIRVSGVDVCLHTWQTLNDITFYCNWWVAQNTTHTAGCRYVALSLKDCPVMPVYIRQLACGCHSTGSTEADVARHCYWWATNFVGAIIHEISLYPMAVLWECEAYKLFFDSLV